ncbi:hypothetical protein [Pseudomonas sp. RIT-PI-S]|uniref:DUF7716 domain-containing protein n=1 Tax=Pseudomonas sp. RIT-PI-S TaxID=3035295 RepID=UPI0021D9AEF5|nr:hypothetical protein [Pseudomonas sp. RIT-PI-S]
MKMIRGFEGLLQVYKNLPAVGGFYVDKFFLNNKSFMTFANYYIPESEEEDEDMEEIYKTWLEYPVFKAIVDNKTEYSPASSSSELLEAVLYYIENDDFLD